MKFFNFEVPPKPKKSEGAEAESSRERLVQESRDSITFEGKRSADAESLETLKQAKSDVAAFLEGIGHSESATRVRRLAEREKIFFFSKLRLADPYSGAEDGIEAGGLYSWEYGAVAIGDWVVKAEGQEGVRSTAVHELVHHAAFLGEEKAVHPVRFNGSSRMRRQAGFDIITTLPKDVYDDDRNKNKFVPFNEGFTETLARMIDPYGWQNPHPYDENRYLVQLVLHALAAAMQERGEASLRDSWLLLSDAYFNNDFSFGKQVDMLLGPGTLRSIANFNAVSPTTGRENPEADAALIERLAARAGLPFNRADYDALVNEEPDSRLRATLKSMEDELRRAALSPISMKKAA